MVLSEYKRKGKRKQVVTFGTNCRSFSGKQWTDGFAPTQRTLSFDIEWKETSLKSIIWFEENKDKFSEQLQDLCIIHSSSKESLVHVNNSKLNIQQTLPWICHSLKIIRIRKILPIELEERKWMVKARTTTKVLYIGISQPETLLGQDFIYQCDCSATTHPWWDQPYEQFRTKICALQE